MHLRKRYALFILVILLFPQLGSAKSYSYSYINIKLNFSSDGSVTVSQERAYNFVGSYSYAYLDILKKGSSDAKFLEIRDLDTNTQLTPKIESDSTHVKATWYYSANNQVKRFLIVYKVEGAVKRYEDVSEFYWKVIEDAHEYIGLLDAEVDLPSPSPSLFKVFVHSRTSPGTLNFSGDLSKAYVKLSNIPTNSFVEFRVLSDPLIFSSAPQIPSKNYENILNEERSNLAQSSFIAFLKSASILIALFIIPIVIFLYFYLKYGREPKVDYDVTYEHEPPRNLPPMTLVDLLEGEEMDVRITAEAKGMIATLFDLARRGYLTIKEVGKDVRGGLFKIHVSEQTFTLTEKGKREKDSLLDFEADVLNFVMKCGSTGDQATSEDITKYCRNNRKVKKEIDEINKKARKWFESNVFPITDQTSREKRELAVKIFLVYFAFLSAYLIYLFSGDFGMPFDTLSFLVVTVFVALPIALLLAFLLTKSISKRTPESALEEKRWLAFKRFISDFSAMKDAPATLLGIWDEYLVYAIVLGVAEKLLENVKQLSIQTNRPIHPALWYYGTGGAPMKSMNAQAMSGFITNLSGTVTALSSSSSVGGGFSGGGGGGGGGGGSGAG